VISGASKGFEDDLLRERFFKFETLG
jgi:hypothetical protein